MTRKIKIANFSCTHELTDNKVGKKPFARYFEDINKHGADLIIMNGDYGGKPIPTDADGPGYRSKIEAHGKNFQPEAIYPGAGNHCRTGSPGIQALEWFDKWMDPLSQHPETSGNDPDYRPFPIIDGDADCYEIGIGENISAFVLSDTARPETPGRSDTSGDPGGVIQVDTYAWLKSKMLEYKDTDRLVFVFSHYGVFETTCGTGHWEGGTLKNGVYTPKFHGPGASNGKNSSFLAYVGEDDSEPPFVQFFADNPGVCHLWSHGHGHFRNGHKINGRKLMVEKYGCVFANTGALTEGHHSKAQHVNPKSRRYDVVDGSTNLAVQAYMHKTMTYGGVTYPRGHLSTRNYTLPKPARL